LLATSGSKEDPGES